MRLSDGGVQEGARAFRERNISWQVASLSAACWET
ncbi:hypothetical protein BH20ACT12_BH20ACT12_09180 [soil metagenome]